jgi:hypothetical protein
MKILYSPVWAVGVEHLLRSPSYERFRTDDIASLGDAKDTDHSYGRSIQSVTFHTRGQPKNEVYGEGEACEKQNADPSTSLRSAQDDTFGFGRIDDGRDDV